MLAYLGEPKDRLRSLLAGISKNATVWTNHTALSAETEQMITNLDTKDAEVEALNQQRIVKITEARNLSADANKLADKLESFANGYHADSPEKLLEYGMKPKKTKEQKPAPTKILIPVLEDDTDGEGFIVTTQYEPNADFYEWQKGVGTNAADDKTIPELKNFKTTKKTSFVDDEVAKGVRIFYRVRAANTNGVGPWSEAVSRVQ
jgi:hypothetical protein